VPTRSEHAEGHTDHPDMAREEPPWRESQRGSQTPGMHGNSVCGTWEALHLAWAITPRPAQRTSGARLWGTGAGSRPVP